MSLPNRYQIEHIADLARLPFAWCEEALRLLAVADISGQIASDLKRRAGSLDFDEQAVRRKLQEQIHHTYASGEIRPLILQSLTLACWEAVIDYARDEQFVDSVPPPDEPEFARFCKRLMKPERLERLVAKGRLQNQSLDDRQLHRLWVQRQIGRRLGVDTGNLDRWEDAITLPSAANVLGAVFITLEGDFQEVLFNDREKLISQAACRTIALIRDRQNGAKASTRPERMPTSEELAIVRAVMRHKFADALLPAQQPNKAQQADVLDDVGTGLGSRFPTSNLHSIRSVRRAVDDWAMPYAHFRIALVSGWHDGTEDEWNWGDIDVIEPRL